MKKYTSQEIKDFMLTIFSIPKSFRGHINIIQRNAIRSWLKLSPKCEIILFGNEEGITEVVNEFNILHIPEIKKSEFGTPLLDSVFDQAKKLANNRLLAYVNTDIILMSDFIPAIEQITNPLFLMSGQRWNLDTKEAIQFDEIDWEKKVREEIAKKGKLSGFSAMDYFVFSRNLFHDLPPFAVGRPGWDNWLIYHTLSLRIPVIDATKVTTIVHQNHDYSHSPWGRKGRVEGPETQRNLELAGGFSNMLTLRDADWILTSKGFKKPKFLRRIFSELSLFYPWRLLLSVKRNIQQLLR